LQQGQRWWRGSKLSSSDFREAYRLVQQMSDEEISQMVRLFQSWYGYLSFAADYLRSPERRPIYRSYLKMVRWGW